MSSAMLALFLTAFAFGLAFNAAPGAVFAETMRQGLHGGFRSALAVQLGSLVGDAIWAAIGLVTVGMAMQLDALRWPVSLCGAVYLLWLSWDSWRAARIAHALPSQASDADRRAVRRGVTLSLTNPQNIAYWAALGGAVGAVGMVQATSRDYAVFFAGFMAASLVWAFLFAACIHRLFRDVSIGWTRFTYRLCAIVLLAFALATLRELMHTSPQSHSVRIAP